MALNDQQERNKYAALLQMAQGGNAEPSDAIKEAESAGMQAAARNASGVPGDYQAQQAQLDAGVNAPGEVAKQAIAANDANAANVIGAYGALGQTGGMTSLPSISSGGDAASAAAAATQMASILKDQLGLYNRNLNPGGYRQYGGLQTKAEHDAWVLGRANELAAGGQQRSLDQAGTLNQQRMAAVQADPSTFHYQNLFRAARGEPLLPEPVAPPVQTPVVPTLSPEDNARINAAFAAMPGRFNVSGGVSTNLPSTAGAGPAVATAGAELAPPVKGDPNYVANMLAYVAANAPHTQNPADVAAAHQAANTQRALYLAAAQNWQDEAARAANPANIYLYERGAENELGVDPYIAAGQWTPQTAQDYANGLIGTQNAAAQVGEEWRQRQANLAAYGQPLTDPEVRAAQDQLNRNTDVYRGGAALAQQMLTAFQPGANPDSYPTVDDLRVGLAARGITGPVADLIVNDYGGQFPSTTYAQDLKSGLVSPYLADQNSRPGP